MSKCANYLIPQELPKEGLSKMQYHVECENDANYFLLNGAGDRIHISVLKNQADADALIEMPYCVFMTSLQDIFIDGGGNIFVADFIPENGHNRQIFKV